MESGTVFTVLGVLATVVFGTLGIYGYVKRRYPGQITFAVEDCLGLFESIVKHFPELAISYKNSPVDEGIVLLKGAFVNTGSKDITREMVEGRLRLELPDRFKWLQAKVVASSRNVQAQIEQEAQTLIFDIGLFRCREFVRFECLAEIPTPDEATASIEKRLLKEMNVTHRIADTQEVNRVHVRGLQDTARRRKRFLPPLVGLTIMGVVYIVVLFVKGIPSNIHFQIADDSGERIEVRVIPQDNGNLLIQGVKKSFQKQIPVSDFFLIPDLEPKTHPNRILKVIIYVTIVSCFLGPFLMYYLILREQRKTRRIRGLLGILKRDDDSMEEDAASESSTTSG